MWHSFCDVKIHQGYNHSAKCHVTLLLIWMRHLASICLSHCKWFTSCNFFIISVFRLLIVFWNNFNVSISFFCFFLSTSFYSKLFFQQTRHHLLLYVLSLSSRKQNMTLTRFQDCSTWMQLQLCTSVIKWCIFAVQLSRSISFAII